MGSALPTDHHMLRPQVIGQSLIVFSPKFARALPLSMIFDRQSPSEREVLLATARTHFAQGAVEEAREQAEELAQADPLFEEAWRLLAEIYQTQNMPLEEIAVLLGYSTPGNFSAAFKRWHGTPPRHYRSAT